MTSSEITRPLHELFAKIYQTERESLESQQKIRDVKKRINTVKMNIHKIKQNMHEKDMEMAEQNVKLALVQSQLNIALAKKKALAEILHKLEADCTAKVRERDHLREQYNNRHNAFCELVENLESLYQRHVHEQMKKTGTALPTTPRFRSVHFRESALAQKSRLPHSTVKPFCKQ
ncbi:hypothetical protein EGR_00497 [Echinococcus granulosus]|uniref:Uncharacterized protein n=1 Tax=Echinococcus granulosus TaxID=6210 RepID=W6V0X1_ECHGR|nr:hypothetical protein EGR_00497 [Echinococcus granulosus]EUB64547.1 hypothetical protein EGR_00497 [Echinococcus granulosus]